MTSPLRPLVCAAVLLAGCGVEPPSQEGVWVEFKAMAFAPSNRAFAESVLKREARFARVTVETHDLLGDRVLILNGVTRTEADKWDARDVIWRASAAEKRPAPKGILNHIWSEEFRDAQADRAWSSVPK